MTTFRAGLKSIISVVLPFKLRTLILLVLVLASSISLGFGLNDSDHSEQQTSIAVFGQNSSSTQFEETSSKADNIYTPENSKLPFLKASFEINDDYHSLLEAAAENEKERIIHTIKRGESLGTILQEYNFPANYPYEIVSANDGDYFKKIRAGKQLEFILDKDTNELEEIHYPYSDLQRLVANLEGEVTVGIEEIPHEIIQSTATAEIEHSLFGAASEAGISDNMIMDLAEIFGWDIDFVRDIQPGDSFKLIYEQHVNGDHVLKEGDIVAVEFINNDQSFTAIRHINQDGEKGYYAPDGSSMKGTFLKSPMKFSRVSSGFSKRRFHPILKTWRAHKGVDYAARSGTPIRSVANGKVTLRGTKGGYGRTIILSHGGKYTTLYAHLSKYHPDIKNNQHVKQGQIIGYVGSSGLATGPHLHYEFRVNGVHRNPLTYKTPKAASIDKAERQQFEMNVERHVLALNNIQEKGQPNLVASNTDSKKSIDQQ